MGGKIAIRREDKNKWERRVPIVPDHVKELINKHGIEVVVQPSEIRAFSDKEFQDVGAFVEEGITECPVTFAVKEIPIDCFRANKTYVFFSHVIKGQPYNMDMLKKMMSLGCNLIDYEKIVNQQGGRLVFFGRYAGLAGMIDTLWSLGNKLRIENIDSPFNDIKQTVEYKDLLEVQEHLAAVGKQISKAGIPASIGPLVIGYAGYGNVSKGAQEILDLLPVTEVAPEDLILLADNYSLHTVYKVVFKELDMVIPIDQDKQFSLQDYYNSPQKYKTCFDQYLPHLTVLVNCIYWDQSYPRLITKAQIKTDYANDGSLKVIGDISVDINGAIEFTEKSTSPDSPSFVYDPELDDISSDFNKEGIVVMAVDNLPCELPRESSIDFGDTLIKFIPAIAEADFTQTFEQLELPQEIKSALILHQGELTSDFKYIEAFL